MPNTHDWSEAPERANILVRNPSGTWVYGTYKNAKHTLHAWYGVDEGNWLRNEAPTGDLPDVHWTESLQLRPTEETSVTHKSDGNKYLVQVFSKDGYSSVHTDVYRMLDACKVLNPALQHLIKKAMFTGLRGHKDAIEDYDNIIESAIEAKQLYLDGLNRDDN